MLEFENELREKYFKIAGCDEAGRGPLAGPVVVACCVMPLDDIIEGVNDSKKLTEKKREKLYEEIIKKAISYNITFIDEKSIDEINILEATRLGMKKCIESVDTDYVLVDAVTKLDITVPYKSIIKGDALSYSIASASILAKVARDRYMQEIDEKYPIYNFKKHKGYGTKEHIENLKKYGPCPIHRRSFISNFVKTEEEKN